LQGDISTRGLGISGDGNVVVGSEGFGPVRAFIWTLEGGMVGIGDASVESFAWDASFDGSVVVGTMHSGAHYMEAFRWTLSEGMVGLGDLPGGPFRSAASAISADGWVIAGSASSIGEEAFIWDQIRGMRSLGSILSANGIDLTGWSLGGASDVSADGQTIVGTGINPDGNTEAWIASIPEPSGLMLMVLFAPTAFHWLRARPRPQLA
jgi:uncharacterized membrane protein